MKIRNRVLWVIAAICGLFCVVRPSCLILTLTIFLPNLGFESPRYYYGAFNSAKHVLESMPDVDIVDTWMHKDVGLESFSFDLIIDGRTHMTLMFPETLEISRETDRDIIRRFAEEQIASNIREEDSCR